MEPAIYDALSPVFKMQTIPGVEERNLSFKCDGCGISGSCLLESGYKLVKTAVLVEVGTQTGCDEITVDPVKMKITAPLYYDSVPSTSADYLAVGCYESVPNTPTALRPVGESRIKYFCSIIFDTRLI